MNCIKCGMEINSEMVYCPHCGYKLRSNVIDIQEEVIEEVKENGPWKNFAMTGHVLGIISLCLFWFAGVGVYIGVFGIIFSSLGKKSKIRHEMACNGFKRSLLATILALVFISVVTSLKILIELINK